MDTEESVKIAYDLIHQEQCMNSHVFVTSRESTVDRTFRVQGYSNRHEVAPPDIDYRVTLLHDDTNDYWYYQTDCDHGGTWCPCLETWFEYHLDRLAMASMVGGNFSLTIPLYPEVNFGICLDFSAVSSDTMVYKDYWNVSADFYAGGEAKRIMFGTADISTHQRELRTLVESQVEYLVDELNDETNTACGNCGMKIEDLDSDREKLLIAIQGRCTACFRLSQELEEAAAATIDDPGVFTGSGYHHEDLDDGPIRNQIADVTEDKLWLLPKLGANKDVPITASALATGKVTLHTKPSRDQSIMEKLKMRGMR